jgi:hypothetical protein
MLRQTECDLRRNSERSQCATRSLIQVDVAASRIAPNTSWATATCRDQLVLSPRTYYASPGTAALALMTNPGLASCQKYRRPPLGLGLRKFLGISGVVAEHAHELDGTEKPGSSDPTSEQIIVIPGASPVLQRAGSNARAARTRLLGEGSAPRHPGTHVDRWCPQSLNHLLGAPGQLQQLPWRRRQRWTLDDVAGFS